jgi:hypothetical protein
MARQLAGTPADPSRASEKHRLGSHRECSLPRRNSPWPHLLSPYTWPGRKDRLLFYFLPTINQGLLSGRKMCNRGLSQDRIFPNSKIDKDDCG